MVTIKMEEERLLELLMDRTEYWTKGKDNKELYEKYFSSLVYEGYLEGMALDINFLVDNEIINNTYILDTEGVLREGISLDDTDKILATTDNGECHLVRAY